MKEEAGSAAGDVGVLVATALARRVVDAIDFPVLIRIPSPRTEGEGAEPMGEAELEFFRADTSPESEELELSEVNEAFANGISEMVQRVREGTIDESSVDPAQLAAMRTLVKATDASGDKAAFYKADPEEIDRALSELVSRRWVSVEVEWVKVEVGKPDITLANPILLSGMSFRVQARVKGCIKVLGKKYCASVTSPWVRLEARQGRLELMADGPRIKALPQLRDLDIVVKIRIWKWTIKVRVGITSLVNKQLKKQGPILLLDLSALEQPVPFSSKKLRIDAFDFPSDQNGLLARASMSIG